MGLSRPTQQFPLNVPSNQNFAIDCGPSNLLKSVKQSVKWKRRSNVVVTTFLQSSSKQFVWLDQLLLIGSFIYSNPWAKKEVPHVWHIARIAAIFKKGDASECANYRPIALLNSSYKLFASILLNRLRRAHVGDSLSSMQFGFRQGTSVNNALFMARRCIDKALAKKRWETRCLSFRLVKSIWQHNAGFYVCGIIDI